MDYIVCGISREFFSLKRVGPEIVSAGDVVIAQRLRNIWRQEQAIGLGSEQIPQEKKINQMNLYQVIYLYPRERISALLIFITY